jgi:hypothetical protein
MREGSVQVFVDCAIEWRQLLSICKSLAHSLRVQQSFEGGDQRRSSQSEAGAVPPEWRVVVYGNYTTKVQRREDRIRNVGGSIASVVEQVNVVSSVVVV